MQSRRKPIEFWIYFFFGCCCCYWCYCCCCYYLIRFCLVPHSQIHMFLHNNDFKTNALALQTYWPLSLIIYFKSNGMHMRINQSIASFLPCTFFFFFSPSKLFYTWFYPIFVILFDLVNEWMSFFSSSKSNRLFINTHPNSFGINLATQSKWVFFGVV